ncbi:vomeronasal type-1 receptor 1-like [Pteronotus mesoamericanus]|uniref:vomeronasal type-1 receptor 1-like n=1 Tax=Pteronotus mesoamericanus TaxID=1884717 RepID=UPI0023ED62E6|nr:vomeronasal type-1 receptor 1-like [Pteronotus parnellii mesoamericanus]
MLSANLDIGIMFLTQTGIGLLGSFSLLCLYTFTLLTGHNSRPTDPILMQLVTANCVALFTKGIPQTVASFEWRYFLDDNGCKCVFYFHSVAVGVSFNTIFLYHGFQAIKLNPSIWRWMELKIRSLNFIAFCCSLCWILQLLLRSCVLMVIKGPLNRKNFSLKNTYGFCSWHTSENFAGSFITVLYCCPHIFSLGFMIWASSSLVLVLHRHKQRVHCICGSRRSPRPSYEARATCTILIQMSIFVPFYSTYLILTIWMTQTRNRGQWVLNFSVSVSSSFYAVVPFALIISDRRVSQLCLACWAGKSTS